MNSIEDVERLEKFIGQLDGLHSEITILSKKSSNDAVNKFKLGLINKILGSGEEVLGENYRPIEGFTQFDEDDMPSTSDVAMVLSQYIEETERFRSDNIKLQLTRWVYVINGQPSTIRTQPPAKIG